VCYLTERKWKRKGDFRQNMHVSQTDSLRVRFLSDCTSARDHRSLNIKSLMWNQLPPDPSLRLMFWTDLCSKLFSICIS
jgi:hypothetical protein